MTKNESTPTSNPPPEQTNVVEIHEKRQHPAAGAEDVTDQVTVKSPSLPPPPGLSAADLGTIVQRQQKGSNVPTGMPSKREFATPMLVNGRPGREAENTGFLAHLSRDEIKHGLVKRHVAITNETDWAVHEIVNSKEHGYEGSLANFIRHAIEQLLDYYKETGQFPPASSGFATDIMNRQRMLRLDMERERLRLELVTTIKVFDKGIEMARRTNDMVAIADRLTTYKELLDNCPSEAQRQQVRGVLLESVATRAAVLAFHRWTHTRYRLMVGEWKDEWVGMSEEWHDWYMDADGAPT